MTPKSSRNNEKGEQTYISNLTNLEGFTPLIWGFEKTWIFAVACWQNPTHGQSSWLHTSVEIAVVLCSANTSVFQNEAARWKWKKKHVKERTLRGQVTKDILTQGLCSVCFGWILSCSAEKENISVVPPQNPGDCHDSTLLSFWFWNESRLAKYVQLNLIPVKKTDKGWSLLVGHLSTKMAPQCSLWNQKSSLGSKVGHLRLWLWCTGSTAMRKGSNQHAL